MVVADQDLTVLASGTAVSGRVAGRDLDVLGQFDGELELSGRVHVAAGSRVKGRVRANLVEIDGDFEGEVRTETLRLGVGASARGKFFAGRIALVDGARLEGDVNPSEGAVVTGPSSSSGGGVTPGGGARPIAKPVAEEKPVMKPASEEKPTGEAVAPA
ncbi:MAG TPA: polymer-forming cytoskeletal protein [Vicinamibacteria bacterium]|nr:polymer-forming cytoskeletal protein [Vicinamibacteria bacterium]